MSTAPISVTILRKRKTLPAAAAARPGASVSVPATVSATVLTSSSSKKLRHGNRKTHTNSLTPNLLSGTPRWYRGDKIPKTSSESKGPTKRKEKDFLPSHRQMGSLIEAGIVRPYNSHLSKVFNHVADGVDDPNLTSWLIPPQRKSQKPEGGHMMGKTPMSWVRYALNLTFPRIAQSEKSSAMCRLVPNGEMVHDLACCLPPGPTRHQINHTFYVSEVILNRMRKSTKKGTGDAVLDAATILPVLAYNKNDEMSDADVRFTSWILINPSGGIFLCLREKNKLTGEFKQMSLSALRLESKTGQPSHGGYIDRIVRTWSFNIDLSIEELGGVHVEPKVIHRMLHVSDHRTPPQPPDFYIAPKKGTTTAIVQKSSEGMTKKELRCQYLKDLKGSTSAKLGCKHLANGWYHKDIARFAKDMLIIDPAIDKSVDLYVGVHSSVMEQSTQAPIGNDDTLEMLERATISEQTLVEIRNISGQRNDNTLQNIKESVHEAFSVAYKEQKGFVRKEGGVGAMAAVGKGYVATKSISDFSRYTMTDDLNRMDLALEQCGELGHRYFPSLVRSMQDMEIGAGIQTEPTNDFSGKIRLSARANLTHNYAVPSHVDSGDAMKGFAMWFSDDLNNPGDWYLIFPNMVGTREDATTYQGVAIKLYHGVMVAWDGLSFSDLKPLSLSLDINVLIRSNVLLVALTLERMRYNSSIALFISVSMGKLRRSPSNPCSTSVPNSCSSPSTSSLLGNSCAIHESSSHSSLSSSTAIVVSALWVSAG
jgi:hypothetical protein